MSFDDVPSVPVSDISAEVVLLDCREDEEWRAGHIEDALHVPMNSIPARLQAEPDLLSPDRPVVVVCRVGNRSAHVTAWLVANGYNAANLEGGMVAWAAAGKPMVGDEAVPAYVM
jgi:rhodanese-related sulfurtransferase